MNEPQIEPGWPSEVQEALFKVSGSVVDARRLVCALYLLMRDCMPVCGVSDALIATRLVLWPDCTAALRYEEIQLVRDRASRLHDYPTPKLMAFMYVTRAIPRAQWMQVDRMTPVRDDVQTMFSNGWLASYARHVADELLA